MADLQENFECPVTAMLELIGGKWKPIILYNLTFGTRRFGEIAVRIPSISRKVLTEQLKELEKDGLIVRKQYKEIPPRVEYSLTDLGKSLSSVFDEMAVWGKEHVLAKR
ncbi:winged helix-turn-helix transcriptional regulator [Parapedobacter sp. DT-150]|uniref:winged helix-turn-helix transcriptional regulator n=1 Tax=Parapedobacter sp. DT-150 TaxID=3396162 RepID=UPI003F1A18A1